VAIKPKALDQWLKNHSLDNREKVSADTMDRLRRKADRRRELIEQLLAEPWGRELWYDIIVEAEDLKRNAMTGNSQSYYILGIQKVAKKNMDWVKEFHFNEWMKMEQEARNRRKED
jgi:hypothetical protein